MSQPDDLKGLLEWRCIGPFRGGRVVAVAGSYHEPNVFYFGAVAGGVWKTTDAGTYWECVSDGFFNTAAVGASYTVGGLWSMAAPILTIEAKAKIVLACGGSSITITPDAVEIHTPKLMASPSESRAELFEVEYFETKAYLAQSPQFFKQMAQPAGFGKVFEVAPAFRADPSFTSRHATEFISVDAEMSWVTSHEDVMRMHEQLLVAGLTAVKEKHGAEIEAAFGVTVTVPELPFPRIPLSEAHSILASRGYTVPRADGQPTAFLAVREGNRIYIYYAEEGDPLAFVSQTAETVFARVAPGGPEPEPTATEGAATASPTPSN